MNAKEARRTWRSEPALPNSIFCLPVGARSCRGRRGTAVPGRPIALRPDRRLESGMPLKLRKARHSDRQRGTPRERGERGGRPLCTPASGEQEKATLGPATAPASRDRALPRRAPGAPSVDERRCRCATRTSARPLGQITPLIRRCNGGRPRLRKPRKARRDEPRARPHGQGKVT